MRHLANWNKACAIKLIYLLFFCPSSIWSAWFVAEVLEGNINNFWVINTKQKHSWLAKKLMSMRETAYPWIIQQIENGEICYFWSGNWSPWGNLTTFLGRTATLRFPVPTGATLAELWVVDGWRLPPARSEQQVQVISYLSTITITDSADSYEWAPGGVKASRFSTGEIYRLLCEHGLEVD